MSGLVLLTGATGFVGRQVLRAYAGLGYPLRIVVREGKENELKHQKGIESTVLTANLFAESAEWWATVCKGVDTVVHVAWYTEPGEYLLSELNIDCLVGTLQLAKGAARAGVRRFVGIGTCFEYDLHGGYLSINTPLLPLTPYAGSKAAVFITLSQWLLQQRVEFVWCRLFYLYGDGEDPRRLVPYLHACLGKGVEAKLTSGQQVRDYLDVAVAGQMIASAALSNIQGPVNICSGMPITLMELAENIADKYGRRDLLIFGAHPNGIFDPPCVVGVRTKADHII